jgi:hypothetical protein
MVIVLLGLSGLLFFPIHVAYQNPDQDVAAVLPLLELARGGWSPLTLHYPPALTNLLHAGYALAVLGGRLAGLDLDAVDLLAARWREPAWFRIPPRLIAMAAGLATLLAASRLAALAAGRWAGLFAAAILGTSLMFVREHHHGMYDAPASAAVAVCLWQCARLIVHPTRRAAGAAGAAAGAALAFKYNAAVVLAALPLAAWLSPGRAAERGRRLAVAVGSAAVAAFVLAPSLVLEPGRLLGHLRRIGELVDLYRTNLLGYALTDVLRNGLGTAVVGAALLGGLVAAVTRAAVLLPMVSFAVLYLGMLWPHPLQMNRYALPLAPAAAVLAAAGIGRLLPPGLAVLAVAGLVGGSLPATVSYLGFLAREDTRVEAARWMRHHVRPDARVYLPTSEPLFSYFGPDLPLPLRNQAGGLLPRPLIEDLERRLGPPFPHTWRFFNGIGDDRPPPEPNSIVVTSDFPDAPFAVGDSPPAAGEYLERHATLLQDYPVERQPGRRVYEPIDLNYVPFAGWETLSRPGPRIRIWFLPPEGPEAAAEPSALLGSRASSTP